MNATPKVVFMRVAGDVCVQGEGNEMSEAKNGMMSLKVKEGALR
jgi:hypothetical protein